MQSEQLVLAEGFARKREDELQGGEATACFGNLDFTCILKGVFSTWKVGGGFACLFGR